MRHVTNADRDAKGEGVSAPSPSVLPGGLAPGASQRPASTMSRIVCGSFCSPVRPSNHVTSTKGTVASYLIVEGGRRAAHLNETKFH